MKIILSKKKLNKFIKREKNLGFVPTMGAIHKGHISLIRKAIKESNKTIVSIFVNKRQFNKKSDYYRYPKLMSKDITQLKKERVDFLFLPTAKEIYPSGANNKIKINNFSKKLCGKYRPGHFEAVVDVVSRFIKIIKPKKIYFGEKDMQQLKIVEDFISKNHSQTKVIECKTIREKNGVAYSSRNFLLSKKQKKIASKIYKLIRYNKNKIINNKIDLIHVKKKIINMGIKRIDYLEIYDVNKIIKPFKKFSKKKIFIAYYLNTTRMIDNI